MSVYMYDFQRYTCGVYVEYVNNFKFQSTKSVDDFTKLSSLVAGECQLRAMYYLTDNCEQITSKCLKQVWR